MIGDKSELTHDQHGDYWYPVFNHDNPSEHLVLIVINPETYHVLSTDAPCCGQIADVKSWLEPDGVLDICLKCPGCLRKYSAIDGTCTAAIGPGLRKYECFDKKGRIYVLHPNKKLGLLPDGGKLME